MRLAAIFEAASGDKIQVTSAKSKDSLKATQNKFAIHAFLKRIHKSLEATGKRPNAKTDLSD